jgi:putative membrane protein
MNADHSETESMRVWRMGQQRLDLMLKFSSSDDHLVAIMLATDNADLSYARMAYTRASTREVKAFAQRMINDHSQSVALVNEIVARNDISPKDNLVSRDLRDEATGQRETMRPLTGLAFDSAYVANEVAYHRRLISMIDDVLLPRLDDGELRQQLTTMRPVLVAHLAHAEQLQATLAHR